MFKYLPLLWSNLRRKPLRTSLTVNLPASMRPTLPPAAAE